MSKGASIPQLLRVHFANIGHPDARLSPLTLDFHRRDDVGRIDALDSVIWAENGVGKSSIRALLFSLLHPNIYNVMKSSNGPMDNRKYELFFGPRDSAFVVTEWHLPPSEQLPLSGFDDEPNTLVLGFVAHWPHAHQASLSDLERHFFMFRPSGPFTFERLPLRGLAAGCEPVPHAKDFMDWFRENARDIDGRHTTVHREWSDWLAEIGLDPMIFAYQLRMNGSQGGILGLFKNRINTPTDFVHFFLETVLDTDSASEVVHVLNEKKVHVEKKSEWEAEVTFVNEALPLLEQLQEHKTAYSSAEEACIRDRAEAGALVAGLQAAERDLIRYQEQVSGEIRDVDSTVADRQKRYLHYQEYRSWLRYNESVLEYANAEKRLAQVHGDHDAAKKALRLLKAAFEYVDWQAKLDECRAIDTELATRRRGTVDVEKELHQAGATYAALLDQAVTQSETSLESAREGLAESRKNLVANQKSYNRVKSELGKVNEEIRGINTQLQNREKVLRRLIHGGVLTENESPANGIIRWRETLKKAAEKQDGAREKAEALEEKRGDLQAKQRDRLIQLTKHQAELERLQIAYEADRLVADELTSDSDLRLLTQEEDVNLASDDLLVRIREHIVACQQEAFHLNRVYTDEKETLANIEQSESRLYPPPREVAKLLRTLREDFHLAVSLAVESLDSQFSDDPDEAEQRFVQDPARFLGIMAQDAATLEKVRELQDQIPTPAFPIQISLADGALSSSPQDALVLRPGHRAAFNRAEAAGMIEPLRKGLADKETRIVELNQKVKRLHATADQLEKFLANYPDGSLASLKKKLEEKRTLIGILEIEQESDLGKIREMESGLADALEAQKQARELMQTCENSLSRLRDFMEDHGSQYQKLKQQLEKARDQLHALEDKSMRLEASLEEDHHQVSEQQERLFQRKGALERLMDTRKGLQYHDAEPGPLANLTVTEAEQTYRMCLDRFRQTAEKDETLRARLEEKQAMAADREKRFRRELGNHEETDVVTCLEAGDVDARLAVAEKAEAEASKAVGGAETALENARERMRQAPTVQLDFEPPEGESMPETIEATTERRNEIDAQLARWKEDIDGFKDQLERKHSQLRRIEEDITLRNFKRSELVTHLDEIADDVEAAVLPADNEALKKQLDRFWERFRSDREAFAKVKLQLDRCCEKLKDLASDPRFQDYPNDKREVLKVRESLMRLTGDIIEEFNIFRNVIESSLRMSEESMEAILTRLDANVSDALYLLNQAKSSSRLPDAMEGWGGLPFLKIDMPGKIPDALVDRRPAYERVLREVLATGKPIRGLDLIKRSIDALAGTKGFRVQIMKPGYALKTDYHAVTEVKGWSDGEKITSVILLYCTMVQLRAGATGHRQKDKTRGYSNGMLFLDNPFGEANSLTFVKMQLTMARALNIQLVYTASGSHKHLMARFPRVIRLSQENAPQTNKTFVKATDVGAEVRESVNVTAAHFGKRRPA